MQSDERNNFVYFVAYILAAFAISFGPVVVMAINAGGN